MESKNDTVRVAQEVILGPNSYPVIVRTISEKIAEAISKNSNMTITSKQFLKDTIKDLSESSYPVDTIRKFVSGGEKMAQEDATLKDTLEFSKGKLVGGDLNFLMNVAKEEHFINLTKSGHPNPKQTIAKIEEYFNKPASEIEELVKTGMFAGLESNIYNEIEKQYSVSKPKSMMESHVMLDNNTIQYSPVGFMCSRDSGIVALMENSQFNFNSKTKQFVPVSEQIELTGIEKRMQNAINNQPYDPVTKNFGLAANWDFQLTLSANGVVKIHVDGISMDEDSGKPLTHEEVKQLFTESIAEYRKDKSFSKHQAKFMGDADNFIMLMENHAKLVNFDTVTVLKNLNEGTRIMFDQSVVCDKPVILMSNMVPNVSFKSYEDMINNASTTIKANVAKLFGKQIAKEKELVAAQNSTYTALYEENKSLVEDATKLKTMMESAEQGSPMRNELNMKYVQLTNKEKENLSKMADIKLGNLY